jgi:hypothetical protein
VSGFSALACDLALLGTVHRRESAIFFGHLVPPRASPALDTPRTGSCRQEGRCN